MVPLIYGALRFALDVQAPVAPWGLQFACVRTGLICFLLNWRLTVTELEYSVGD